MSRDKSVEEMERTISALHKEVAELQKIIAQQQQDMDRINILSKGF
jgi:uncharacterized coiled-coil protein SlyX